MKFEDATPAVLDDLEQRIGAELRPMPILEAAAQHLCSMLYEQFIESSVLVRLFATVPFGELPPENRGPVRRATGDTAAITGATPVLSLLGTRGVERSWNERTRSRGHVGIPLTSPEFLETMPMMARLLKQLGATVSWDATRDTTIVTQTLGRVAGAFYVADARTETDASGRPVIPAHDFVEKHDVRTVFGFGGSYVTSQTFMVVVVFTREAITQRQVERFMRLSSAFKAATMRAAVDQRIFAAH